jgi:hypothetical protein
VKRLLASYALLAVLGAAEAAAIPSYLAQLDVAADGGGEVRLQLRIDDAAAGPLLVPLAAALKPAGAVKVDSAPVGTQVRTVLIGEKPHLELLLPEGVEKSFPFAVSFAVKESLAAQSGGGRGKSALPPHSLRLDHAFVNTQPVTIGSYRVKLMLPDGKRVHRVIEQSPRTRRTEVEPRVTLNGVDGRQGAVLQLADIKTGDRTSISLEVVGDDRPLGWLLVGVVLAVAYLYGFRDLVRRPQA